MAWILNSLITAVIIFTFCTQSLHLQAFRHAGQVPDLSVLGATMYTCVVWAVNLQMALSISYFTYIQHIFIWGSIFLWYIFLLAYGAMSPTTSTTAYQVFVEAVAPSPYFWLLSLLAALAALVPYFAFASIQMRFFPMFHQMVQWIRKDGQIRDPEYVDVVRQRSIRHTTVGYTARLASTRVYQQEQRS